MNRDRLSDLLDALARLRANEGPEAHHQAVAAARAAVARIVLRQAERHARAAHARRRKPPSASRRDQGKDGGGR